MSWVHKPKFYFTVDEGCMYACMVGHTYSKSMDQLGNKVANPARGQLNPRQPAHLHTQAESSAYLRDFSRVPRRRPFITL